MRTITRADFLAMVVGGVAGVGLRRTHAMRRGTVEEARIAEIIRTYDQQGHHRTGTSVDELSAVWLARQIEAAGGKFGVERFPLQRVDIAAAYVQLDDRRADALPFFDGAFTDARGVEGTVGPASSPAPIVLTTLGAAAISAEGRSIAELRRSPSVRAIVAVTKGAHPGLTPANAADFTSPYGVPVLQVGSEHESWLQEAAAEGRSIRVVSHATRVETAANNLTVRVSGDRDDLPPVMVITPRSGWWHCASERGGGLACWLEAIRAAAASPAPRPVWFLASSGHELGHLGLDHFLQERPALIKSAAAWIHLGANIGATGGAMRLQASDDEIAAGMVAALARAGAALERQVPRGTVPAGEARNIHVGGGRYVSLLGTSPFFHSIDDRFPNSVDVSAVARYAAAVVDVLKQLRHV